VRKFTLSSLMFFSASCLRRRLELVVADDDLRGQAAELSPVHLHREQECIADVDPERGARPESVLMKPIFTLSAA